MKNDRRIAARLNRITIKKPMSADAYRTEAHAILHRYNMHDSNFYHFILEIVEASIPQLGEEGRRALGGMIRRCQGTVQGLELNVLRNKSKHIKKEYRNNHYE
ncbi:hypothetical protein PAEPH01_0910 [Pancytospora epiphaga]|nr:hypothetical protein PAEPH01_0910 [Pancytospora epiphaga]